MRHLPICLAILLLSASPARADEYAVAIGKPSTGSNIPRNRASLGIPVNIERGWDQLAPEQQAEWRRFTDLLDPAVTPPFPSPNIRTLLRKLVLPDIDNSTEDLARVDGISLIVNVSETGKVSSVEVMGGTKPGAEALTRDEKILVYRYSNALLNTAFSPALLNGKPVASAFPMRVEQLTVME
jgi:hypothetical protein